MTMGLLDLREDHPIEVEVEDEMIDTDRKLEN